MSECIHGLDEEWCASCKRGPEKVELGHPEYMFTAKFDSYRNCIGCDLPMKTGQQLVKMSTGENRHEGCE